MSGRSCSLANTVFFEANAAPLQKTPKRITTNLDAPYIIQLPQEHVQGKVWLLLKPSQKPVLLTNEPQRVVPATRKCRCGAGLPVTADPTDRAGLAHAKDNGSGTTALTRQNGRNNALS
jgi:hypothetical protein